MNRSVFIVGPTSSGKTYLAHKLALHLGNAEIISADSMQVFKRINILSAKPSQKLRYEVPYHLIDCIEPYSEYSVAQFYEDSVVCVDKIFSRGNIPIIVGGTGLYIRTLLRGIFDAPSSDEAFRARMHKLARTKGNKYLHAVLAKHDPDSAHLIPPENIRRIIRALEVFHLTGQCISSLQNQWDNPLPPIHPIFGKLHLWCVCWPRNILYERINERVDIMYHQGLIDEVDYLLRLGIGENSVASQAIGIKEIKAYLNKDIPLQRAMELIKRNTRRFAKRQLTWFAREEDFQWFIMYNKSTRNNILNEMIRILLS